MLGIYIKCKNIKREYYAYSTAFLAAVLLFIIISPNNLGFSPDSMVYLEVSENILKANGIINSSGEVVDHWPPLYSIALSIISYITSVDPQQAGLIYHPILLCLFLIIYYKILCKIDIDQGLAIISSILLGISQVVTNFMFYLSEGQFLVLLLTSFYFFVKWNSKGGHKHLFITGIFCGLLFLTRYAAIGFIGGYLLFILLASGKKDRWKNIFYFSVAIALVVLPWFIYLGSLTENPSGRSLGFYLISLSKLTNAITTMGYWFLGSFPAIVAMGALVIFYFIQVLKGAFKVSKSIKNIYHRYRGLTGLLILLISVYSLFLMVSISFYDPWTPLDNRLLSPVFPFILILITMFFKELKEQGQKWLLNTSIIVLCISFSSSVISTYLNHYQKGSGYTKNKWERSETVNYLKQKSFSTEVYTNGIEIAKLHGRKEFQLLPFNSNQKAFNDLIGKVKNEKAQIIFFEDINWRNNLVSKPKILNEFENIEVLEFRDGFIVKNITSE